MESTISMTLFPAAIWASGVVTLIYLIFRFLAKPESKFKGLPTLGKPSDSYLHDILIEGHQKFPDTAYTVPEIPHESNTLILPQRYIDEVKSWPESELSFSQGTYQRLGGKYTTLRSLGSQFDVMVECVKVDLTRNIARTLEGLQSEADFAIPSCIGECKDWTPIKFYPKILRVIALLSGRIFVGLPLCRNEEWINTTINYAIDAVSAVGPVGNIPPLLRPFVAPWIPEVRRIKQHRINGAKLIRPILEERLAKMKEPDFKPPTDVIQFAIQNSGESAGDALFQCCVQMLVSLLAIHTTAMNITQVMYNLAMYPEYQEPLRKELKEVLAMNNDVLVKASMTKLRKMDSFIKESQRMNPPSAVSLRRLALSEVTLSDGFRIPKGTYIAFSSIGINYNPETFPNPETFDGFRFSNLREQSGNENRYQFVTTGVDAISFGHGKHACPGRFFASNEIKVILAGLLLSYDFKFRDGEGRPENTRGRTYIRPNKAAEVLFRKRAE